MNRKELRALSDIRLHESQALFRARYFSGAYYLAGYAVECALKACIATQFKRYEFPDKKRVNDSYTPDIEKLANLSGLDRAILDRASSNDKFRKNWTNSIPATRISQSTGLQGKPEFPSGNLRPFI